MLRYLVSEPVNPRQNLSPTVELSRCPGDVKRGAKRQQLSKSGESLLCESILRQRCVDLASAKPMADRLNDK